MTPGELPAFRAVIETGGGASREATIRPIRHLGSGRASRAMLVEVDLDEGRVLAVEKHFLAPRLTRVIYAMTFLAPFPYSGVHDAALACLYRRRVAQAILAVELGLPQPAVSDALYIRRCAEGHHVLGTRYVKGRPVAPTAPASGRELGGARGEMRELLDRMRGMERSLVDAGLSGTGWQVSTAAVVATANFLRESNEHEQFVCVDLESGIPAVLVPRYVWLALRTGKMPLFDDLDEERLRRWARENREPLRQVIGDAGLRRFDRSRELLIEHSAAWKEGEPAPARHRLRLLFDRGLRRSIRDTLVRRWIESGRLDTASAERVRASGLLFLHPLVALGALPTSLGRFVHRLAGNRSFRARIRRAMRDPTVREAELRAWESRNAAALLEEGRVSEAGAAALQRGLASARLVAVHRLCGLLPRRPHRFLTDWSFAGAASRAAGLALASERVQERLARSYIRVTADRWQGLGRIDQDGRNALDGELGSGDVEDTLRGFGMHLGLKFFEPLTAGMKLLGFALFFASPWNPLAIALILNTSILRTLLTALRWLRGRRRGASYAVAFAVGLIPVFGTLAFPLQLYERRRWLTVFLMRTTLSRVASSIPVYGGPSTRIEYSLVSAAPIFSALLTAVVWPFARLGRRRSPVDAPLDRAPPRAGWLTDQVEAALLWMDEESAWEAHDICTG